MNNEDSRNELTSADKQKVANILATHGDRKQKGYARSYNDAPKEGGLPKLDPTKDKPEAQQSAQPDGDTLRRSGR